VCRPRRQGAAREDFYDPRKSRAFVPLIKDASYDARVNKLLFADVGKSFDLRSALHAVPAPVVIVQAYEDRVNAIDDIRAALPQAKVLWIDHAGLPVGRAARGVPARDGGGAAMNGMSATGMPYAV
jgi:hypothetical protein